MEILRRLTRLLMTQQLESFAALPDFVNYLMFVFARIENEPVAQTVAGHLLKNNVARAW